MYMKNGFTLIELLVVVLIIGILAAIALPQYQKAVERSRGAEGILIVQALGEAEKRHFLETGTYTQDPGELDIQIKNFTTQIDSAGSIGATKDWSIYLRTDNTIEARRRDAAAADESIFYILKTGAIYCYARAAPPGSEAYTRCASIGTYTTSCPWTPPCWVIK